MGGSMRLVWVVVGLAGCTGREPTPGDTDTDPQVEDCDVPLTAAELAGPTAIACGSVALGDPLADAWACAVAAFQAGDPFWVGWEDSGIDTVQSEALLSNGTRTLVLYQDHEDDPPWRIDGSDCVGPYVGEATDNPYDGIDEAGITEVLCASREPVGNHYQVCGECAGCGPPALPFVWP